MSASRIMLLMSSPYADPVLGWYAAHARDLPWRAPGVSPWAVLVSEIMLQQTPVSRVLPAYQAWLARWPTPAALAADPPGEAVRQWGRLGYPRRALRLHETAVIVTEKYAGELPVDARRAAGAAGDRRLHGCRRGRVRLRAQARGPRYERSPGAGAAWSPGASSLAQQPSVAEYRLAESLLPDDDAVAARWSVAVMELGALTCTAAAPRCDDCPVAQQCAWLAAGRPAAEIRPVGQTYEGTDRQCRGRLLAVLRDSREPVPQARLDAVWPDHVQRARALDGLVADGLVDPLPDGRFALPRACTACSRRQP